MSPIIQVLVAIIIVCILIPYSLHQDQKNRKSWLHAMDILHSLASETGTIIWEAPVYYSSENYFKLVWKDVIFEGFGLLCQLEDKMIFLGYFRNSPYLETTLNTFVLERTYVSRCDPNYTFIEYTFDLDHTEVAWLGCRPWVNGGYWFTLSTQRYVHYFSAYLGKRLILGSKAANKKIYSRLTSFLRGS